MVSNKHAGFIVNVGHATSADVVALIRAIQESKRSFVSTRPRAAIP
ncbi:MAG: hypothetical protein ACLTA1_00995 [Clostridia bacterium]